MLLTLLEPPFDEGKAAVIWNVSLGFGNGGRFLLTVSTNNGIGILPLTHLMGEELNYTSITRPVRCSTVDYDSQDTTCRHFDINNGRVLVKGSRFLIRIHNSMQALAFVTSQP